MATFNLHVNTDNDAFGDEPGLELARILRGIAREVEHGYTDNSVKDYNGNAVGSYDTTDDDTEL